jgi:iron complex outermembrane recepter protein
LYGKRRFVAGSYTLGLQYQMTPDVMFFLTDSKGFGAGGFQLTNPAPFQTTNPESLHNFEIGTKSRFSVGPVKMQADVSYYYGRYEDIIVQITSPVQIEPPPAPPQLVVVDQNAAQGLIKGVDAAFTIIPWDRLELNAAFALNQFTITSWPSVNSSGQPISLAGTNIQYTPKYKYVLGGTFHLPVPESLGEASISANFTHQSMVYTVLVPPGTAIVGIDTQPAFGNLNINFDWNDIDRIRGLGAELFVTNFTQNRTALGLQGDYESLGTVGFVTAEPREFGVRLRYKF